MSTSERNWAKAQYIFAARVVVALNMFRRTQKLEIGTWNNQIDADIKAHLLAQEYVGRSPSFMLLRMTGLEVMSYREATG